MGFWGRFATLFSVLFIFSAQAATVIVPQGEPIATIGTADIKVPIYKKIDLQIDGAAASVPLNVTGGGDRIKTLVFDFPVYSAVSYISADTASIDPRQDKAKILAAVRESKTKLLQMTMLTDLGARDIRTAFKDALRANKVDLTSAPIAELLGKIVAPFPVLMKINVIGDVKEDHLEVVRVEMANQEPIIVEGTDLASTFWKVWFADPVDDNMAKLQDQLINQIGK